MIEQSVSLASNGVIKVPGYEQMVRFGYTKNRGVYRLAVTAAGEWEGLAIRCFWHVPGDSDPASSLVVDGLVDVPASVTAQPGDGCITFEGSDGTKTVTSADLRYRVSANSGTEDGTEPEPGTPAWQQLMDAVHKDATAAEQAKTDAQTAAQQAADNLQKLKDGIASGDFKGDKGDPGPAGQDGKDAPQIDDTTVTDSAPWSSKHIVDVLCPPLEETGNPVVCYPVENYPLGVTASWEPTQEGTGDPSPDNVRPIKGRDSVTVERCGENLLDEACFPIIKTNNNIKTTSKMTLPPGTYTVCVLSVANGVCANGADVEHTYNSNKHTFTLARQTAIQLDAYWEQGRPENDKHIWLVEGSEWRTYAHYTGQTTTLTLPRTIYGGSVDAVTGEGEQKLGLATFDGSEEWTIGGLAASKVDWYYVSPKIVDAISDVPKSGNEICSHFPHYDVANNNTGKGCALVWSAFRVRWGDIIPENTDAWKSYLAAQYAAGTPVQIAYKLEKPIPFTATGAQPIPALPGVNVILTDADSVTVTGRADPIKRITDLEDAVASMTNT